MGETPLMSLADLNAVNQSLELQCLLQQLLPEDPIGGCPMFFDSILCWPVTPPATWAVLPCFKEFRGFRYDSSQNATRYCHLNGKWDNYSNYDRCHFSNSTTAIEHESFHVELSTKIYDVGYTISIVALIIAVIIFCTLKDLRCARNTIHINLFVTYILYVISWILTLKLELSSKPALAKCITLAILMHYFTLTNFFWMMVEGLYLYMLVVETFSGDKFRFGMYAGIGWGVPVIFISAWALVKGLAHVPSENEENQICSWMDESRIDWIFQAPACFVLFINLVFLIRIMWVLITKLRSANTVETRQYRKAAKALMVLIPLLGITYLALFFIPGDGMAKQICEIIRAILLSTQGFFVCLFFCFLNSEVQHAIKHRYYRWKDSRNFHSGQPMQSRRHKMSKDYSPRSRTESIRLTSTSPMA